MKKRWMRTETIVKLDTAINVGLVGMPVFAGHDGLVYKLFRHI